MSTNVKLSPRIEKVCTVLLLVLTVSCKHRNEGLPEGKGLLIHSLNRALTESVIADGHKPPVASRIYTYPNIAAYEILSFSDRDKYPSVVKKLLPFKECNIVPPPKDICLEIAATEAFIEVAKSLVYRDFIMDTCRKEQFGLLGSEEHINASINYGQEVAKKVISVARRDGYDASRNKPKHTVGSKPSSWKPTPPKYSDACEPYWAEVNTFILDSSNIFLAEPHTPFDTLEGSGFYNEAKEVYDIVNGLNFERKEIASFWDDNPSPMQIEGHAMKTHKQLTPPGHWMKVAEQVCLKERLDNQEASKVYCVLAIAMADAFKSVWFTKYHYDLIRPVTYINRYIDPSWSPYLETPMFPEYTSAHSTVSGAASVVMEGFFGTAYPLTDSSEVRFGHSVRRFNSFSEMAYEVSISRLYGGIHYRKGCDEGLRIGEKIGYYSIETLLPEMER